MSQTTAKIIKSNNINIDGNFQIGTNVSAAEYTRNMNSPTGAAQAFIEENNSEYIVIKVICSCGKEISIKGNYNNS